MAYAYSELLAAAQQWAAGAAAAGRLSAEQVALLQNLEPAAAAALFNAETCRDGAPLIVAFMGGTGVGKSSLLNRLAGQAIARAGIERPTSREVTLYHHSSLGIDELPEGLPLDSIKISRHDDERNSHIVWIDMPDFDSVELGNQRLVLEWLPHIDVLLYVVSPERYRDNKAWQLLLAEGAKHAWLFVMNQWDRGLPVQYDDFRQQLAKAGFADPLIFRTSCSEPHGDEFGLLLEQLRQLSGRHNVAQLERRNRQLRLRRLQQTLQHLATELGGRDFQALQANLDAQWQQAETQLQTGLAWAMQQLAKFWADNLGDKAEIALWDAWAQNRLDDMLDELVLQAAQAGLPTKPLKAALQNIREQAGKTLAAQTELAGRQAMLRPGNGAQRFLLKLTAAAETVLPLAAMGAVGYQVFSGYYHSTAEHSAYLGTDFAVHSLLLIGLSWLIPFFLHKKIQPSLYKAGLKGLRQGLQHALAAVFAEIKQVLVSEQQRNEALRAELQALVARCAAEPETAIDKQSLLGRVLLADAG
ncbi:GTPase [Methylomonas koyamae]|uniref:GTP-binding protein n=1 Tax=Methylomonas koyamae TaxID=702114 RepID=A0A291IIN9_9GAMM|nr:GTPase [Methylomonas koyamae]ATG90027.1 GTP-binding protein [Methylomonas koyamae]OAI24491.1 GTP-binding protein [Methylomonas koyamae]